MQAYRLLDGLVTGHRALAVTRGPPSVSQGHVSTSFFKSSLQGMFQSDNMVILRLQLTDLVG